MKVVLFLPNLWGGGAERMMVNIANGLARRGVDVDLVLAKALGPYLDEVHHGVRIVDLGSESVLRSIPALVRYLREHRPHSALGTLPYANLSLLLAARIADRRIRVYLREATTPSGVKVQRGDYRTWASLRLSQRFYRSANGVVAVSAGVAQDLQSFARVPDRKVVTIYNPVVTPELHALAGEPLDHPWFGQGEPPVILSVGRLKPEKNFDVLLRAFALLRKARPARLMILGEGGERERLEELARSLGVSDDFAMPGFVNNPLPYMRRASLYALSSEREGLPGALIQAMAVGTPVVSTDCPNGPREVLLGGRFGPLVDVGDDAGLAVAMAATLDNPLPPTELQARAAHFSEEASIDAYERLLRDGVEAVRNSEGAPGAAPAAKGSRLETTLGRS